MKRLILVAIIAVLVTVAAGSVGYAISQLYRQVAGIGNVEFVDQVSVQDISVTGQDRIRVKLVSNAQTEASHVYTVTLYLNGEETATTTTSWTAPQIPGVSKVLTFSELALGSVTQYGVEVRR